MEPGANKVYFGLLKAIAEVALISYTDPHGKITYANDLYCKISGYSLDDLLGNDHRILKSDNQAKDFFTEMYRAVYAGEVWRGEISNKRKDGTIFWVDTQIVPIYNKDKVLESIVSVGFDISERKQMEESLINADKLATLGEMSAIVAHEINNPVAVINMYAENINKELSKPEINKDSISKKIEIITGATKKILKIVSSLKTAAHKSGKEDYVKVNVKTFVDEALLIFIHKCSMHGVDLIIKDIPDLEIECRPDQITQIIINLVGNAFDAIAELENKWIELSIKPDGTGNFLIFSVRDSGPGIPEDIAEKILTPFFTTKGAGKGTGLGLSISKTIIEEHQGELFIDKHDKNTHFYFKLPVKAETRAN